MPAPSRNNGETTGRDASGRFAPGNPGRKRGARHKATVAAQALLDGEAEQITRVAVNAALAGDATALRLCLERIAPPRKDAPVNFDLPRMETTSDAARAAGAILSACGAGELTPLEAASVMQLVETFRRTMETTEIEARLVALEGNR